jgi:molecular chaperone DnaK (HSP70)
MVEEAERLKKEDDARLERIEARNELESFLYSVNDMAVTMANDELISYIKGMRAWTEDAPASTSVGMFKLKQREVEKFLAKIKA